MYNWHKVMLRPEATIREAMERIGQESLLIVLVTTDQNELLGVITDGDIRRGLLKHIQMSEPVTKIMRRNPIVVSSESTNEEIKNLFALHDIQHIPVIDEGGRVVRIESLQTHLHLTKKYDNWVFLMAGGMGTRLRPLTDDCPKPLLHIGDRPILENIIQNFLANGFHRFYISVNYKAEMVMNYFGDGSKWNAEIVYIHEKAPLGTAGALGLIPVKPSAPIIIMNGDLLTTVDFTRLLEFHRKNDVVATICMREFDIQVPYGVIEVKEHLLQGISEKPMHKFFVNAGIYILEPSILDSISANEPIDMPQLLEKLRKEDRPIAVFPIHEYWLDIGRLDDFQRAQMEVITLYNDKR